MTPSNFGIVPCELSDMAMCVDIFNEAFAADPTMLYLHPYSDPKVLKERASEGFKKSYTAPGTKYFKAVHIETGYFPISFYYFSRMPFTEIKARKLRELSHHNLDSITDIKQYKHLMVNRL
jgi:hypothetical protein